MRSIFIHWRLTGAALILVALLFPAAAAALELNGKTVQGGILVGKAAPGSTVTLEGEPIMVADTGEFVIAFAREETGSRTLRVEAPDGAVESRTLDIEEREFRIERVDGLPPRTVTPDPESLERIRNDAAMVREARSLRAERTDFAQGFDWPAEGRISGVYGSQRILNGEPRNPHWGLDIAAPKGTPVRAPAAGVITLAQPDLYYSGGTVILDHGHGLSSTFLHLSRIHVAAGDRLEPGDLIGEIGATGRATGPHLDWRMNWLDKRVDPQTLLR